MLTSVFPLLQLAEARQQAESLREAAAHERAAAEVEAAALRDAGRAGELASLQKDLDLACRVSLDCRCTVNNIAAHLNCAGCSDS